MEKEKWTIRLVDENELAVCSLDARESKLLRLFGFSLKIRNIFFVAFLVFLFPVESESKVSRVRVRAIV